MQYANTKFIQSSFEQWRVIRSSMRSQKQRFDFTQIEIHKYYTEYTRDPCNLSEAMYR